VDVTDNTKSDNQMVCPQKLVLDPVTVRPGERLNVQLDISLVDGCYFNKEAPNKWALYTEGMDYCICPTLFIVRII